MTAADSNVDNAGRGKFPETVRLALENGSLQGIEFWPETTAPGKDEQVLNEIAYRKPDILIVPPEVSIEDGLAVAAKVDREYPQLSVVLVGEKTADLYERAFRAGARGLIDPAASVSEIRETLEELQDATRRRQSAIGGDASETTLNRVVPVLAAKGGVGKTTLASNLAASLAFSNPGEVVIVDLDLQFGDVASTLGITPESTISDTVRFGTDLDGATVKAFLTPALDGKLFALAAPDLPAHADELTPQHVAHVLTLLRRDFPFVVIDTAAGIDEFTLEALDAATDIAVLTSMDVPSVRATAKEIDALVLLGDADAPSGADPVHQNKLQSVARNPVMVLGESSIA